MQLHEPQWNCAFAAFGTALFNSDKCRYVAAAENSHFAALRNLASQQWGDQVLVIRTSLLHLLETADRSVSLNTHTVVPVLFLSRITSASAVVRVARVGTRTAQAPIPFSSKRPS